MRIVFIRHAMTQGNLVKRYIGVTDEDLCEQGIKKLNDMVNACKYPDCDKVFVSPMIRCRRTADIIYPNKRPEYVEDFRECNFGRFEGKNYTELNEDKDYQRWIDSNGKMPFPEGENIDEFKERCVRGFIQIISDIAKNECENVNGIALVIHGGTIMSIMENFEEGHRNYYDYQIGNGEGYVTEFDGEKLKIIQCIT